MQLGSLFHLLHYYLLFTTGLSVMQICVSCKLGLTQRFTLLQHPASAHTSVIKQNLQQWFAASAQSDGYTDPLEDWGRNCFSAVSILLPSPAGDINGNVGMSSIWHSKLAQMTQKDTDQNVHYSGPIPHLRRINESEEWNDQQTLNIQSWVHTKKLKQLNAALQ